MKRIFALLLCLALFLTACGGQGSLVEEEETETAAGTETSAATSEDTGIHDPTGFSVGFARGIITPQEPTPLGGYAHQSSRLSENVLDDLMETCLAFSDGETTILLFTGDMQTTNLELSERGREKVAEATGLPGECISFSATHSHSAVAVTSTSNPAVLRYRAEWVKTCVALAQAAIADLDRAELYAGTTNTDRLNFVRRYVTDLGEYTGDGFKGNGTIVAHESEADTQMRILKIDRANQKDILLVNWQAHPQLTGGEKKTNVSADWPGQFRKYVEQDTDLYFAYYQGAAGNLNAYSRISSENRVGTNYKAVGKALAQTLEGALSSLEKVETGKIGVLTRVYEGTVDHSMDAYKDVAAAAWSLSSSDPAGALQMLRDAGIETSNILYANHITSKAAMGPTKEIFLYAYSLGDVALYTNNFEMFCVTGEEIRAASPFRYTFNVSYSNGGVGYIPSALAFEHGGYEVSNCKFIAGTAELVRDEIVSMLTELYQAK